MADSNSYAGLASGDNPLSDESLSIAQQIAAVGAVYLIGKRAGGAVKIGWSLEPLRQLRQFQTGHAATLRILVFIPGPRALERGLHEVFADLRIAREWYQDEHEEISSAFRALSTQFREGRLSTISDMRAA